MIEDPCSLFLNQRCFYSVFLIFDKHNSPRKIRIKIPSIRPFHSKTPAVEFLPAKNLVNFSQNHIPENVYQ